MLSTPQQNPLILPGQSLLAAGFNPDIDTASVPEDIWPQGGQIQFPDVAAVVDVVSTSALDTAAGTGAQALAILGVDANFNIISEIVILDGLTPVATLQLFLFVQTSILTAVGSLSINQGLITFTVDGNLCNVIAVAKGQTQSCALIIPTAQSEGTRAHLVNAFASVGRQQGVLATVSLTRRRLVTGIQTEALDIPVSSDGGSFNFDIITPVPFDAGERVVARVTEVSANNTLASAILTFSWF